jgi:transcriptional regulator with XRE-family HTH domain
MIDVDLLPQVARKIREIRSARHLSLTELSRLSNISKGLLSKIENSRTVPSLPVFMGVVNALGVSLKDFFDGMDLLKGKDYLLIKKSQQQVLTKEHREGFHYEFITAQSVAASTMEMVVLTVMPGARSVPTTTDGYEFKYILAGTCDYFINEEIVRLESGDALYFDARKPHMPVNRGMQPVIMLVIYFLSLTGQ